MLVTNATFDVPFEGTDPRWKLRVVANGADFLHRAAPVVAMVGTVRVEAIVVNLEGDKFFGLLRTYPQLGDTLRVGYLDTELIDTGIPFQQPPV